MNDQDKDQANALLVRAAVCLAIPGLERNHLTDGGGGKMGRHLEDSLKVVMNLRNSAIQSYGPSDAALGHLVLSAVELAIAQAKIHTGSIDRPYDPKSWLSESFAAILDTFSELR
jgi:hypothetical protein